MGNDSHQLGHVTVGMMELHHFVSQGILLLFSLTTGLHEAPDEPISLYRKDRVQQPLLVSYEDDGILPLSIVGHDTLRNLFILLRKLLSFSF